VKSGIDPAAIAARRVRCPNGMRRPPNLPVLPDREATSYGNRELDHGTLAN
jgi:hypothetical protein